jgi:uncharacterized protein YndB with AHSA1/START domain
MIPLIAIVVVLLVVGLLIAASRQPAIFRVARTLKMKASPEKIFGVLDDFHAWSNWSPWEKLDPQMKRTHSGAARGPGAVYAWEGNKKAGAGRMEITDVTPGRRVAIKLDFLKPWEAHNQVELTLEQAGESTNVTWAMSGPSPFMFRLMGMFMNLDRMIGKDFETGLANIQRLMEQ